MKESLSTKLIKHFFGIAGELDEHRKQVIGNISSKIAVLSFYFIMIQMVILLISLVPDKPNTTPVAIGILIIDFLYIMGISFYLMYKVEDAQITDLDVEEDRYELTLKQAKRSALRKGILMTIGFPFLMSLFNIAKPDFNFIADFFSIKSLISGLVYGIPMWLFIRAMMISRIKK